MQRATFSAAAQARLPTTDLVPAGRARAAAAPLLAVEGISISFGGVRALSEVNLTLWPGEIRAVIGPNGAGKSSLINIISGLYRPDQGRIRIGGVSYANVSSHRLSHLGIARTFQNLALFGGLTVRDNIASGLTFTRRAGALSQIAGLGRARREEVAIAARVDHIMHVLHLEHHSRRLVATLPYGLQKRVELARALVAEPKILLLDEPMAGMTATEKAEMAGFVRAERDRLRLSIILIEHDIGVVMGLSDTIAVLDYGRKIADGTPAEVRSDPDVIRAYMGAADDGRVA